jgi:hypothetical protein
MGIVKRCYDHYWDEGKAICVDKSPQNLCRAKLFEKHFSQFGEVYFIVMTRDPYSYRGTAEKWVEMARLQRKNQRVLKNVLSVTYEDLVLNPDLSRERLRRFLPELGEIDMAVADLQGLNSERNQPLNSKYANRIVDKRAKNRVLSKNRDLLKHFGYQYRP